MLKIDCHAHILPASWPSLKNKYGYGGWIYLDPQENGNAKMMKDDGTFFREIEPNCWDPEAILVDMNAHNVDVMVLCTVPVLFSYWAEPKDTLDWARFLNDDLAQTVAKHPKRFVGLATLPMQDIDLAIKEMWRIKNELGMNGVQIGSNINGMNLDDKVLFPFWEAAQEMGVSVFVHPWEMMGANRTERFWLQWLVGMPAETANAISSMIFGGVFDFYPKLKVLFAHAGGAFPFTIGRLSHGWNVRPDLCNVNRVKDPREYVGSFWVDSITHDPDALAFLVRTIGANKIAYGTDYPFPLGDLEHGKMIEDMDDLAPAVKQQLFQDTVAEFLGLDPQKFLRDGE
jgi:aminocarboxymuconate-semialdehyde decarboxylase